MALVYCCCFLVYGVNMPLKSGPGLISMHWVMRFLHLSGNSDKYLIVFWVTTYPAWMLLRCWSSYPWSFSCPSSWSMRDAATHRGSDSLAINTSHRWGWWEHLALDEKSVDHQSDFIQSAWVCGPNSKFFRHSINHKVNLMVIPQEKVRGLPKVFTIHPEGNETVDYISCQSMYPSDDLMVVLEEKSRGSPKSL